MTVSQRAVSQSVKFNSNIIVQNLQDKDFKDFLEIAKYPAEKVDELIFYYKKFSGVPNSNGFVTMSLFTHAVKAHQDIKASSKNQEDISSRIKFIDLPYLQYLQGRVSDPKLKMALDSVKNYVENIKDYEFVQPEPIPTGWLDYLYNIPSNIIDTVGKVVSVPYHNIASAFNYLYNTGSNLYQYTPSTEILTNIAAQGLSSWLISSYTPYNRYKIELQILAGKQVQEQANGNGLYQSIQYWKKNIQEISSLTHHYGKEIKKCTIDILDGKKCALPLAAQTGKSGIILDRIFKDFVTHYSHLLKAIEELQFHNKNNNHFSFVNNIAIALEEQISDFTDISKVIDNLLKNNFAYFEPLKDITPIEYSALGHSYKIIANYFTYNIENDFASVKHETFNNPDDGTLYIQNFKYFVKFVDHDIKTYLAFYKASKFQNTEYYEHYNVHTHKAHAPDSTLGIQYHTPSNTVQKFSKTQIEYYKNNDVTSVHQALQYYKTHELLTSKALDKAQVFAYLEVLQLNMQQLKTNLVDTKMLNNRLNSYLEEQKLIVYENKLNKLLSDNYAELANLLNKNYENHNEEYYVDLIKTAQDYCSFIQQFLDSWLHDYGHDNLNPATS